MELENRVTAKWLKMLLCTKPVLTQTPSTPQGSPYLASHHGLFLAELRITNMSEKNAVWMARNMVLFFPILSLHLTTFLFFFFFALLLSYSYCKMSGIQSLAWNLTDLHFRQGCDNRFELDLPSLGTSSFICLFQRTRRVVAPDAKKGHLYIWLGSKEKRNSSVMDCLRNVILLYCVL